MTTASNTPSVEQLDLEGGSVPVKKRRTAKPSAPLTASQRLGSIVKSARDIMRKDKGLSGDLDRLPMLTWIMFLKFLDDMEQMREFEAEMSGERFRPAIEPPYRWRDWAANEAGITGNELIAFVNNEEAIRPDGTRGAGLFAYLRRLQGAEGGDRRDVIATVFQGINNRMINGYLLRDVINKINEIHFNSSNEVHILSHLYESMLKAMRDAAGDSGEFYTPRAVVRFMVEVIKPRIGETVLDPACGTGGFLVEAYTHMQNQAKTIEDRHALQKGSVIGGEAKPLPYLLAQMNLLLHGMESPRIDPGNSLRFSLNQIGDRDRVDVIMTNPPFGGEEERGIQNNFPADKQTSETALLFLQLIMRKLKRPGHGSERGGRAAVVVPDGILAGDSVSARIKQELLTELNLHTVVRLPEGVFSPYTTIPSNLLFFDRSGPTKEVWFYEITPPNGRKNYTKTQPMRYEEFEQCLSWWKDRTPSKVAWRVSAEDVVANGYNLDVKNPSVMLDDYSLPLADRNAALSQRLDLITSTAKDFLDLCDWQSIQVLDSATWPSRRVAEFLHERQRVEIVHPDASYKLIGVQLAGNGPFLREVKLGQEISAKRLNKVVAGDFIYSRLFAWRGAFGLVSPELDGCYASNEFPTYEVDTTLILPEYLSLYFSRPVVWKEVERKCQGTTKASRNRFKEEFLLAMAISIPDIEAQQRLVHFARQAHHLAREFGTWREDFVQTPLRMLSAIYRGSL